MGVINGIKNVGNFWFGTWNDEFGKNVVRRVKDSENITSAAKNSKSIITESYKAANYKPKASDKSLVIASENVAKKGFFSKGIGAFFKKMPMIGGIITAAIEVPKIASEYKKGGLGAALKQTGRAAISLTANAVGCAVAATALAAAPFTGGASIAAALVAYGGIGIGASVVGEKISNGLLGKSITDKEEEAKTENVENTETTQTAQAKAPFSTDEMAALQKLGDISRVGLNNPEVVQMLGLHEQKINPFLPQSPASLAMYGPQQFSPEEIERMRQMQMLGQGPMPAFSQVM